MTSPDQRRYLSYEVEDLLTDERFLNWCLRPEPEESSFWDGLAARDEKFRKTQERARELLVDLRAHYAASSRREAKRTGLPTVAHPPEYATCFPYPTA